MWLPENQDVCSSCGLCCTDNCQNAGGAQDTDTPIPTTAMQTTSRPTTTIPPRTSRRATTSTQARTTTVTSTPPPVSTTPATLNQCGDGILVSYKTDCWSLAQALTYHRVFIPPKEPPMLPMLSDSISDINLLDVYSLCYTSNVHS